MEHITGVLLGKILDNTERAYFLEVSLLNKSWGFRRDQSRRNNTPKSDLDLPQNGHFNFNDEGIKVL